MKIRSGTIGKGTLPVLAAAFLCTGTQAQITPGAYVCGASFARSNNFDLAVANTAGTCTLPVEFAHWFDLSVDAQLSGSFVTLKCIDFSMWGTTNPADQLITLRVFQDLTPSSSDAGPGSCDDQIPGYDGANEPGPELAGSLLLGEDETFIPVGVDPAIGPRLDGDFSVEYTGDQGGGILLEPDIAFYVVVAHAGESIVQFGGNVAGEVGDATIGAPGGTTGGPEQTWIRPFNCSVGASLCTQTGDWVKAQLYYGANMDTVMQIHLDLGDTRNPPALPFDCRQDIVPFSVDPITGENIIEGDGVVNVNDLLGMLASWNDVAPPRPLGDIVPCPTPGADCFGDNNTNVQDLLALLAAWGPCPNLVTDCNTTLNAGNLVGQVGEGTFPWTIDAGSIETAVERRPTNVIPVSAIGGCGWANYFDTDPADARTGTGTEGGFIWGDAFGVFAGNFNTGGGTQDLATVGGDVWFQYTASCNGRAFISATSDCGAGEVVDTILEVYPGATCPADWTESLFCNDQRDNNVGDCGNFGEVDFNILDGEQFLVRIAGWFGEVGSGSLNISCVDNSLCPAALPVLVNGASVSANTLNAGVSSPPVPNCPITQDAGGRWFSVIGDGNTLTASTCQTAAVENAGPGPNLFDAEISIYCGTVNEVCADLECVASSLDAGCNLHDEVSWCTSFGTVYYILVHGNGSLDPTGPTFFPEGFFILDVTTDGAACATAAVCGVTRPVNDLCANATVMTPGTPDPITGISVASTPTAGRDNNLGALTDGPDNTLLGCTLTTRDVWYSYTAPFDSTVVVSTCNIPNVNVDTALEVYIAADAECPPVDGAGLVACNNNALGCPGGASITAAVIIFADQEILIRLGADGGDKQGFYTMTVTATPIPPDCDDPLKWDNPCPPGALLEGGGLGETLIDDGGSDTTNGGCMVCAPGPGDFDSLVPSIHNDVAPADLVVCGAISTYASDLDQDCVGGPDGLADYKDTDWYTITIPFVNDSFGLPSSGATVIITFASEFPAEFGFTDAICGASPAAGTPFVASAVNGGLCTDSTFIATLAAGNYYFMVTSRDGEVLDVGGTHPGHDYHLTVQPLEGGGPVAVTNDECVDAISVSASGTFFADQRIGASQNAADPVGSCIGGTGSSPIGSRHFANVWYVFNATHTDALVSTCGSIASTGGLDSSVVVFEAGPISACVDMVEVGCNDDSGVCDAFLSNLVAAPLVVGVDYYISVGAWSAGDAAIYQVDVTSPAPPP